MITFEQAYRIFEKKLYKSCVLSSCSEYPDFWVFYYVRRSDGERLFNLPIAVKKIDGYWFHFFFPKYPKEYTDLAVAVSFDELEKVMNPEDFVLAKKYRQMIDLQNQNRGKKK